MQRKTKFTVNNIALLRHDSLQGSFTEREDLKTHLILPIASSNIHDRRWSAIFNKTDAAKILMLGFAYQNIPIESVVYWENWCTMYDDKFNFLFSFKDSFKEIDPQRQ